jgi:hypothetical protein
VQKLPFFFFFYGIQHYKTGELRRLTSLMLVSDKILKNVLLAVIMACIGKLSVAIVELLYPNAFLLLGLFIIHHIFKIVIITLNILIILLIRKLIRNQKQEK